MSLHAMCGNRHEAPRSFWECVRWRDTTLLHVSVPTYCCKMKSLPGRRSSMCVGFHTGGDPLSYMRLLMGSLFSYFCSAETDAGTATEHIARGRFPQTTKEP